jgi:hypothetical protein
MSEGSIALGVGRNRHSPGREPVRVVVKGPKVHANPPDPNIHHIDSMMLPRGLPIAVPNGLKGVTIPANLVKFAGSPYEDPTTHVERFVEVLIINLVTNHDYYFIWFPSNLVNSTYAWYRSHAKGFFNT